MKNKIIKALLLSSILLLSSCSMIGNVIKDDKVYGSIKTTETALSPTKPSDTKYINESPLHKKFESDADFNVGLPASGDVKTLVIPVQIGDDRFSEKELKDISLAFNGTSEETGYESVHSYYYKASKGKLNLKADITPVYVTGKSKIYYDMLYFSGYDVEYEIIRNALTLLNPTYNFSNYDYNKDGFIDSIYLIYSCSYNSSYNDTWWAWCYEYFTEENEYYDDVEVDFYCWASVDFLKDKNGNGEKIAVNAETFIHETGHLFGLDDYYDYNEYEGANIGTGGGIMMDSNVGDQDPLSKILLGWSTPTIINKSGTYNISPSVDSNECYLLPLRNYDTYFSPYNKPFNEYLLIDYYTPTGLNRFHKGTYGLFDEPGIRIFHVDARIDKSIGNPKNPEYGSYYTIFSFNNSDTEYGILQLIEGDNNNSVSNVDYSENSDLFQVGDELLGITNHSNTKLNFKIKVNSLNDEYASFSIEL